MSVVNIITFKAIILKIHNFSVMLLIYKVLTLEVLTFSNQKIMFKN